MPIDDGKGPAGSVHLICTLDPERIEFLPQFVAHYAQLGVQQFHLTLQFPPNTPEHERSRDTRTAEKLLEPLGAGLCAVLEGAVDHDGLIDHQTGLRERFAAANDWIVWTDIDEFQVYPHAFPLLLQFAEHAGIDYFWGRFVDRLAATGLPAPFQPNLSIWSQYPRRTRISRLVGGANDRKVTCARGDVHVSIGHHLPMEFRALRFFRTPAEIHHFKWDGRVMDRLRRRAYDPELDLGGYCEECRRLLAYFETIPRPAAAAQLNRSQYENPVDR